MTKRTAVADYFVQQTGMDQGQARYFLRLCGQREKAEVRCCNERDPDNSLRKAADKATDAVEKYATKFGLLTDWPGLWPVLVKDGRSIYLPG